ncbi:MAG: TrkH family potassium uptake protein, partial [Lachnospiraceae bacterium]|nr:TrkH family potassium uptake protein [Lachnospiraceae bacterium]
LGLKKAEDKTLFLKEGCVTTALSWIVMSTIGALPFYITGEIPKYIDACFETVSGFTTTGSSILNDIESLSHASLFWRSGTHWIGGMGVLVFLLSIVSLSGGSTINLMKAESPGPSVGKLVPKIKASARYLYLIYAAMTFIEALLLVIGGCPVFDAITLAFGTAGTGGFAIRGDSVAGYSAYVQWVITVFMILFGVNFNVYYFILMRHIKDALKVEEVKYYLLVILSSIILIFINVRSLFDHTGDAIRHTAFTVASIITTTGFATVDFDTWNTTCKIIIVMLMFIGACAGSTGGGIKVSRFVIIAKTIRKEINSYIHPRSIKKIIYDGKPAEHVMIRSVNVYMATYILILTISILLVSFEEEDIVTTVTSVITCFNNIGPGLNKIGPTCNFSFLGGFTKLVLMFDMLAGRLELFPLVMLFHPRMLKELVITKKRRKSA